MAEWTRETFPLFNKVLLELQSNCNRECFFCPRTGDDSGKRRDATGSPIKKPMPTEQVFKIMDQLTDLGYRGLIAFHHLSEPFLDPRVIDMARQARERGFRPYEHTNGDILRQRPDLCAQAAEVFDYICVGLYDYTTDEGLAAEKTFWREALRGSEVLFSEVGRVYPRSFVPFDGRMVRLQEAYPRSPCSRPLERLIVHYDGGVGLCCDDMRAEFNLGNAFETPIREIWFSEQHVAITNALNQGHRHEFPLCSKCPLPPMLHSAPEPDTGHIDFGRVTFANDLEALRSRWVGASREVALHPNGTAVACEVFAGKDPEQPHYGGVRVPVERLDAVRFELCFFQPDAIMGFWVDGDDDQRRRVMRWQWSSVRTRPLPDEPTRFVLVPGEPVTNFRLSASGDPELVRQLHLFLRVKPGARAGFNVTSLEVGRCATPVPSPATQASRACRP